MKTDIWKEKSETVLSDNVAENYEKYFVPVIGRPFAEDLVRKADLQSGEKVLDVASGTGIIARIAAVKVGPEGSVTGIDVNPGMLKVAGSINPDEKPIKWIEASAEAMPLSNGDYDVALCQMGLQFFEDKESALKEIYRVLVKGGRFVLNLPAPSDLLVVLDKAIGEQIDHQAAGFAGLVYSLKDPEIIQRLLYNAGFHKINLEVKKKTLKLPPPEDFLWQYVYGTPLASLFRDVGEVVKKDFEREVVKGWDKLTHDQEMIYEQPIIEVIAHK